VFYKCRCNFKEIAKSFGHYQKSLGDSSRVIG
jgi:hypothetical protein